MAECCRKGRLTSPFVSSPRPGAAPALALVTMGRGPPEADGARFLLACHMELLKAFSCSQDHALQKVQFCWRHPNQSPRPRDLQRAPPAPALLTSLPGAPPGTRCTTHLPNPLPFCQAALPHAGLSSEDIFPPQTLSYLEFGGLQ